MNATDAAFSLPLPRAAAMPGEHDAIPDDAAPLRTLVLTSRQQKPPQEELRRLIADGELPDTVSADDQIGATIVDDRYFTGADLKGRLLGRLPLLGAQAVEVLLTAGRYDAVVTWGERHSLMVACLLRLRRRRPGHVAILIWPSRTGKAALLVRLSRRSIDRFIVPSPLQRRFVAERLGVPEERLVDARYPVDTDYWRPVETDEGIVCSAGQEMRDYRTLFEALRPLDIPCHVAAGQGLFNARFLHHDWDRNVGEVPIPENVTVARKSQRELRELYARSRFVVVPILPSDNDSGITVISEAFAMGKAVICTDSPGQTGLLQPGVNCLRVPPHDPEALRAAILELWNHPEKCRRFGAAGRRAVVERHGLDQWKAALRRAALEAAAAHR